MTNQHMASRGRQPAGRAVVLDPDSRRTWFLTWTTYGSWLPGDDRGFTGAIRDASGRKVSTRSSEIAAHRSNPALFNKARALQQSDVILLSSTHAKIIAADVQRSCEYLGWHLSGLAVMATHLHVLVTVSGDPEPDSIVRDLKAYASRALNREFPKPAQGWWTRGASKRVLKTEKEVLAKVQYIRDQPGQLALVLASEFTRGQS